jgi:hypothetical protein
MASHSRCGLLKALLRTLDGEIQSVQRWFVLRATPKPAPDFPIDNREAAHMSA